MYQLFTNATSSVMVAVKLKNYLANFNNLQLRIEYADEAELDTDERDNFEEGYFEPKSKKLLLLNKTKVVKPIERQLLKLPTFFAILTGCLDFWSAFEPLVHSKNRIPEIDTLLLLRNCLTDNAAKYLQSVEITSKNY